MTDDALTRLRQERKAAIAALSKVKPRRLGWLTFRRSRPTIMSLGRLVRISNAEERLAEIDMAIDELESR